MDDVILDHAARILGADERVAMTVTELATALGYRHGVSPGLERRLREDDRFVLLDGGEPLPGLEVWSAEERAAYAHALDRLELGGARMVLLRDTAKRPAATGVAALAHVLRRTVLTLLDLGVTASLAASAEQASACMAGLTPAPGAGRSTTPPPDPPPPT